MRPELELIEKIEQYLSDQLPAAEKAAFEEQLAADPNLREAVQLQQDIRAALHRASLAASIRRARQHYYRTTWLKWGGIGLGTILVITALILLLRPTSQLPGTKTSRSTPTPGSTPPPTSTASPATIPSPDSIQPVPGKPSYPDNHLPTANETGDAGWSSADSNLDAQTFWLSSRRDTVIETSAGIVLSIPAAAFLNANHQPVTGTIELVLKEALDAATILKAGLSTYAGDRLLETGGMFFLDARQNGRPLRVDANHAIYAEIPTDKVRPDMQLFTGKRLAGGIIDWTNPRPLEHDLLPVDIHLLNFYPPHYLDSVAKWGYNRSNRTFTDSLYFSFARLFSKATEDTAIGIVQDIDTILRDTILPRPNPATRHPRVVTDRTPSSCGINPAKIAAIWNDHFQNTLLATREFEQRLILIHQSGDNDLLDLYVNHLDKSLCTIDSLAAAQTTGNTRHRFLAFAARHDGKVKHGDTRLDKLREYYQNKAAAFAEAVTKTSDDFWQKNKTSTTSPRNDNSLTTTTRSKATSATSKTSSKST
jgi:hypothetical protein